jgi:hypothetical protein
MKTKQLVSIAQLTICLMIQQANAQILPTPEEFQRALRTCNLARNIGLGSELIDSISKLYSGENSRQVLKSPAEFLLLIPENMRIDAYRLYADCIVRIIPQIASTSPPVETRTYKVCTGEYERACQLHDVYLYCGQSVEAWASARCTSHRVRRLNTYGGNKCGYATDEITCIGPK